MRTYTTCTYGASKNSGLPCLASSGRSAVSSRALPWFSSRSLPGSFAAMLAVALYKGSKVVPTSTGEYNRAIVVYYSSKAAQAHGHGDQAYQCDMLINSLSRLSIPFRCPYRYAPRAQYTGIINSSLQTPNPIS